MKLPSVSHRYGLEIPEPAPSLFRHGAPVGVFRFFPVNKITVMRRVRMYCHLSLKINMHEMPHSVQDYGGIFVCVCFHMRGWRKPEYSQLALHG